MSGSIERTLRIFDIGAGECPSKPVRYWRTRPLEERLRETLSLHREGNALFNPGNPPFAFRLEFRQVAVIGLDDLIRNKRAVGRLQDLADIESLDDPGETSTEEP